MSTNNLWETFCIGIGWNTDNITPQVDNRWDTKVKVIHDFMEEIKENCDAKETKAIFLLLQEAKMDYIPVAFGMTATKQSHPFSVNSKLDTVLIWDTSQCTEQRSIAILEKYGLPCESDVKDIQELFTSEDIATAVNRERAASSSHPLDFKRMSFVLAKFSSEKIQKEVKILIGTYHGRHILLDYKNLHKELHFELLIRLLNKTAERKSNGNFILSADTNIHVKKSYLEKTNLLIALIKNIYNDFEHDGNAFVHGIDVVLWQSPDKSFRLKEIECNDIEKYILDVNPDLKRKNQNEKSDKNMPCTRHIFDHRPIPFELQVKANDSELDSLTETFETMAIDDEINQLRVREETEDQWKLRKAFLRNNWNNLMNDSEVKERLVCRSQIFINFEFLGCEYKPDLMTEVQLMAEGLDTERWAKRRKVVEADDAAFGLVTGGEASDD